MEEVINESGILTHFPQIDLSKNKVGIFGKITKLTNTVRAQDRIEIYRPLIADPKEARKKRAAEGKQLKNRAIQKKAPKKPAAGKKPDEETKAE